MEQMRISQSPFSIFLSLSAYSFHFIRIFVLTSIEPTNYHPNSNKSFRSSLIESKLKQSWQTDKLRFRDYSTWDYMLMTRRLLHALLGFEHMLIESSFSSPTLFFDNSPIFVFKSWKWNKPTKIRFSPFVH